jgi:hypothetical protein
MALGIAGGVPAYWALARNGRFGLPPVLIWLGL